MEPIPLPSHVHYELLLQLLERQTLRAVDPKPALREPVQQLIVILRKALAQQKHLEAICQETHLSFEYHWSLNSASNPSRYPSPQPIGLEDGDSI